MRRVLGHALGAVAIGLLLVALAVPALAQHEVALLTAQNTAVPAPPEKPPGRTHDAGVRALPLAPPGGLVARDFPDGRGLDDTERVRAAIDELLPQLGLQAVMSRLLKVMPEFGETGLPVHVRAARHVDPTRPPPGPERSGPARRGRCGHADGRSRGSRRSAARRHHRIFAAHARSARRATPATCRPASPTWSRSGPRPTWTTYVARSRPPSSCVRMDPTPSWLWAKFLSTQAAVTGEIRQLTGTPAERRRLAETAFADLRTRYPDLPVGYAGAADLYLDWADSAEREGGEPFQVRAWRRQAAELYAQARQRSDDPRLAAGHARALSVLQQGDAAIDLINQAVTQDPDDPAIGALRSTILGRAGRHAEAAAAIAAETTRPPWWSSATSPFASDYLSGGYASAEYPPLTVLDQTPTGYGAGGVDDISFIPRSRYPRSGSACRSLVAMEEWLLAGQPDRVHQLIAASSGASIAGRLPLPALQLRQHRRDDGLRPSGDGIMVGLRISGGADRRTRRRPGRHGVGSPRRLAGPAAVGGAVRRRSDRRAGLDPTRAGERSSYPAARRDQLLLGALRRGCGSIRACGDDVRPTGDDGPGRGGRFRGLPGRARGLGPVAAGRRAAAAGPRRPS